MIDKEYGKYHLICDACGEPHTDDPFDSFEAAKEAAEDSGWTRDKIGTDWINICPSCQGRK